MENPASLGLPDTAPPADGGVQHQTPHLFVCSPSACADATSARGGRLRATVARKRAATRSTEPRVKGSRPRALCVRARNARPRAGGGQSCRGLNSGAARILYSSSWAASARADNGRMAGGRQGVARGHAHRHPFCHYPFRPWIVGGARPRMRHFVQPYGCDHSRRLRIGPSCRGPPQMSRPSSTSRSSRTPR